MIMIQFSNADGSWWWLNPLACSNYRSRVRRMIENGIPRILWFLYVKINFRQVIYGNWSIIIEVIKIRKTISELDGFLMWSWGAGPTVRQHWGQSFYTRQRKWEVHRTSQSIQRQNMCDAYLPRRLKGLKASDNSYWLRWQGRLFSLKSKVMMQQQIDFML